MKDKSSDCQLAAPTSLSLSHPDLRGGKVGLIRRGEHWMATACTWPDGRQQDALDTMVSNNLELTDYVREYPSLVRKDEVH